MNETLIKNWNKIVKPGDTVFHLGDFAFGGSQLWNNMLDKLNGNIYLIKGNHDLKNLRQGYASKFKGIYDQLQIEIEGRSIYLNHYPFLTYGGCYRGKNSVWALSGHTHISTIFNSGKDYTRMNCLFPTQYDVGVDFNDFSPVSWSKIKERIEFQIDNKVNLMYWIKKPLSYKIKLFFKRILDNKISKGIFY